MINDPLAVFLTLAVIVYVAIWLEHRSKIIRALSSVLTAILIAAVASNVGLLPSTSATYDALGGFGVNVGIALVLLGVDVKTVRRAGPKMLAAFGLGAVGTALGAILGALWSPVGSGRKPGSWPVSIRGPTRGVV